MLALFYHCGASGVQETCQPFLRTGLCLKAKASDNHVWEINIGGIKITTVESFTSFTCGFENGLYQNPSANPLSFYTHQRDIVIDDDYVQDKRLCAYGCLLALHYWTNEVLLAIEREMELSSRQKLLILLIHCLFVFFVFRASDLLMYNNALNPSCQLRYRA